MCVCVCVYGYRDGVPGVMPTILYIESKEEKELGRLDEEWGQCMGECECRVRVHG